MALPLSVVQTQIDGMRASLAADAALPPPSPSRIVFESPSVMSLNITPDSFRMAPSDVCCRTVAVPL